MSKRQVNKLLSDAAVIKAKNHKAKETIDYANTYLAFLVNKISGLSLLTVGSLEFFDPSILHSVVLDRPLSAAAVGMALISGKGSIELIKKIVSRGNKK